MTREKPKKPLRLKHPDFGYVEFHNTTPRQRDVLKLINEKQKVKTVYISSQPFEKPW